MKVRFVILALFLLMLMLYSACAPASTSQRVTAPETKVMAPVQEEAQEPWLKEWNKTVEASRKEGSIAVISTAGPEFRSALTKILKEKFGLDVWVVAGKGAEVSQRLISEQRAGLYQADVYMGGATTPITELKPAGVLSPFEAALILPEVLNRKAWLEGQLPWIDKDRTLLASAAYPNMSLAINTQQVKPGELKSYRDFLNPKWKGKILMSNPTMAGVGGKWAVVVGTIIMNWDYLRELVKQEPVIITDQRIQVEWIAKGKYPFTIVPKPEIFKEFQEAGAPIKGTELEEGTWLATGSSGLALVKKAPHPNAARLLINWILTKEGQTFFSRTMGIQSARLDVPTDFLDPQEIRSPSTKYFNASTEEFLMAEPEKRKIVVEIFGPLIK